MLNKLARFIAQIGARPACALMLVSLSTGCVVIPQGEVGLKRVWGRIEPAPLPPGLHMIEQVSTDVVRVPIRTTRKMFDFVLPSKEGLNINARITLLYRVDQQRAVQVISTLGTGYEEDLIAPVFRSQAADVSTRFLAKDMYGEGRRSIEKEIANAMRTLLEPRGFVIESVLMKSIELPEGLAAAIERKLQAEQRAQEMRFVIDREKLVAKRKRIQAEGDRDAQKLLAESLTEPVLRWLAIQAFERLSTSSNARVVITDGSTPLNIVPPEPGPYDSFE